MMESQLKPQRPQLTQEVGKIIKNKKIEVVLSEETKHSFGKIVRRGKGLEEFVNRMKKQIRLAKQLINLKHQVKESDKEAIVQILQSKYQLEEDILQLQPQELDPFFRDSKIKSAEVLVREIYIQHQLVSNHWKEEVLQQFDRSMLDSVFQQFANGTKEPIVSLPRFAGQLNKLIGDDVILKTRDVFAIYQKLRPMDQSTFTQNLGRIL